MVVGSIQLTIMGERVGGREGKVECEGGEWRTLTTRGDGGEAHQVEEVQVSLCRRKKSLAARDEIGQLDLCTHDYLTSVRRQRCSRPLRP